MPFEERAHLSQLRRSASFKGQIPVAATELGPELIQFYNQAVKKRQTKLSTLAEYWDRLVPQLLAERCALQTFHRGTLVVIVDSAVHLYDLKQLLLAGLEQQLLLACRGSGLKKINLKLGQWRDETGRPDFG